MSEFLWFTAHVWASLFVGVLLISAGCALILIAFPAPKQPDWMRETEVKP